MKGSTEGSVSEFDALKSFPYFLDRGCHPLFDLLLGCGSSDQEKLTQVLSGRKSSIVVGAAQEYLAIFEYVLTTCREGIFNSEQSSIEDLADRFLLIVYELGDDLGAIWGVCILRCQSATNLLCLGNFSYGGS